MLKRPSPETGNPLNLSGNNGFEIRIWSSQPYHSELLGLMYGRMTKVTYVPDFFIREELIYVECKMEEHLEKDSDLCQYLDRSVWLDPVDQEHVNDVGAYFII